jgi:hypothetical protein
MPCVGPRDVFLREWTGTGMLHWLGVLGGALGVVILYDRVAV